MGASFFNQKTIVIGCDNAIAYPILMNYLKGEFAYQLQFITVTSCTDLLKIIIPLNPVLIISSFNDNQLFLSEFGSDNQYQQIPIFCITNRNENLPLTWHKKSIVFVESLQDCIKDDFLIDRLNSILSLIKFGSDLSRNMLSIDVKSQENYATLHQNLTRYILELDQKVDTLLKARDRLKNLLPVVDDNTRRDLLSILSFMQLSISDQKHWDDFELYFEKINPDFIRKISKNFPSLTPKDIKYCCYLKMNMSNNDISNQLGINQESVRTHKYRLKMKMALSKDQDLQTYLNFLNDFFTVKKEQPQEIIF